MVAPGKQLEQFGALVEPGMTKTTSPTMKRKPSWFAPRQVYLRAGRDSAYVELSTMFQVCVALGFGLVALWLIGASYGAVNNLLSKDVSTSLISQLEATEAKLVTSSEEASKVPALEAALVDARATLAEAQQVDETAALSAELQQTREQLENLRQQLSEAKAGEATLQAKLEAQTIAGEVPRDQPAEEASSLHAQLEDAFAEIEQLEQARDESQAKIAALVAENASKDDDADRNQTLLNAATEEIERLQAVITEANRDSKNQHAENRKAIDELTVMLRQEQTAKKALQQHADRLEADLKLRSDEAVDNEEVEVTADAERHAAAIAAELKEVELLATIDNLRAQIGDRADGSHEEVDQLKAKLALAETEIETILKNTLSKADDSAEEAVVSATSAAAVPRPEDADQIKQLTTELSNAKGAIIKLNSDVRTAKKRLAEQTDTQVIETSKQDNSAKLQQQLASTRSRIQQLNKALADAKLREVAIDLALISVVPSPSPPAPR